LNTKFKNGHITWNTGLTKESDTRLQHVAECVSKARLGTRASAETRNKLSKMRMGHPFYGGGGKCKPGCTCKRHTISQERKEIYRIKTKARWESWSKDTQEAFIKKCLKASATLPNKEEKRLDEILQKNFPTTWKYVGDGEFILARKNPDFINIQGKKEIIELWGEYFHSGQDPKEREAIFKEYGYTTLIIWCKELKDEERLVKKITKFFKKGGD